MSLNIYITIEEYDEESWKNVTCSINGEDIIEYYSYPFSTDNGVIESEVEQDLTNKGYIW